MDSQCSPGEVVRAGFRRSRGVGRNPSLSTLFTVLLAVALACRGERRAPETRETSASSSRAESCADRLSRLRTALESAPKDVASSPFRGLELPIAARGARRMDREASPVLLRMDSFEFRGAQHSYADVQQLIDRIGAGTKLDSATYLLFADRRLRLFELNLVLGALEKAHGGSEVELRLIMAKATDDFRPYELPPETPARVKTLHRDLGDMFGAGEYEEMMQQANRSCRPLSALMTEMNGMPPPLSSPGVPDRVIDAISSCACEGVDVEVAAGLLLAANAHVSPFQWWPLVTQPSAEAREVQMPSATTVEGLAEELAKDPKAQPVHLVVR